MGSKVNSTFAAPRCSRTSSGDHLWRITSDDGSHKLAVTKAFDLDRPMWLVSGGGAPLAESTELVDQWSRLTDLPPYQPIVDQAIRTSVIVPLRRRHVHGVYYFQSCMHLGVTDVAKADLQMLGDATSTSSATTPTWSSRPACCTR